MRDVELNPHEILQAIEEHLHLLPTFAGRDLRVVAVDQARSSSWRCTTPAAPAARRSRPPTCSRRSSKRRRASRCRSSAATASSRTRSCRGSTTRMRDHRAARGAAEEALRAAAVPQALRHQPQPARAPGQAAAGVRPRQRDAAGARDPLPPRARQLGDAARRARRRQDRDRRRARAPHRVRARDACRCACATARSSTCR